MVSILQIYTIYEHNVYVTTHDFEPVTRCSNYYWNDGMPMHNCLFAATTSYSISTL